MLLHNLFQLLFQTVKNACTANKLRRQTVSPSNSELFTVQKKNTGTLLFTKSWLVFISGRLTIFSLELNKANRHLFYKYYFALVLCRYSFLCKHVIYLLNTKHEKYWKNIYALLDKILLIHYIIIH